MTGGKGAVKMLWVHYCAHLLHYGISILSLLFLPGFVVTGPRSSLIGPHELTNDSARKRPMRGNISMNGAIPSPQVMVQRLYDVMKRWYNLMSFFLRCLLISLLTFIDLVVNFVLFWWSFFHQSDSNCSLGDHNRLLIHACIFAACDIAKELYFIFDKLQEGFDT